MTTGAVTTFVWAPERLNFAILESARASFDAALAEAKALQHERKKSGIKMVPTGATSAELIGTGLQPMFERGRRGGYSLKPVNVQALHWGDNFASSAVGGPMRPYPAMGPAAEAWAHGTYQRVARGTLAASGF